MKILINLYNADKIEIYQITKAKEDSKNELLLLLIEKKENAAREIYKISDIYRNCTECKKIFCTELKEMLENLSKQNSLRDEYGLLTNQAQQYRKSTYLLLTCRRSRCKSNSVSTRIFKII